MIRRRRVLVAAGGALLLQTGTSRAQSRHVRIGLLREGPFPIESLRASLATFGYVEERNLRLEPRFATARTELPHLAAELVSMPVDLIVTDGSAATRAAQRATGTIPIVFVNGADPVQAGLVSELAKPGRNVTGFTYGLYTEKMLEALAAALPTARRIAAAIADTAAGDRFVEAGRRLGLDVRRIRMTGPDDVAAFFAEAKRIRADAVLLPNDPWLNANVQAVVSRALEAKLPTIGPFADFARAGTLLSYGAVSGQHWPRIAHQIDRILRGASPGDLPVEQPTTFELVVNRRTAAALGITIPTSVLARAVVIE